MHPIFVLKNGCDKRDVWDRLAEETRLCRELAVQLAVAHQRLAELVPAAGEVANLRVREANACRHAVGAEEKATALVEHVRKDDAEAEQVRKERDDLLQTMAGLHVERDLA
jgi:hypothetical protein